MRSHLYGAVARVGDGEGDGFPVCVEGDGFGEGGTRARCFGDGVVRGPGRLGAREARTVQGEVRVALSAADGVVNRDEFGAVGKGAFHLHFADHGGDAGQDVVCAEQLLAFVHEHGHRVSVADKFEELGRDEGYRFRVVETQAAGIAFLGEEPRVVEEEFVDFFGR